MTVKDIEEKTIPGDITFFTGVMLYQDEELSFMFDLTYQHLFIFDWEKVPRDETKQIWESMCSTFHENMGVRKLELE